jgi:hypothetical protein
MNQHGLSGIPASDSDALSPETVTTSKGNSVQIIKCYPEGKLKAFVISFDDGTSVSDAKVIAILNEYDVKGTFFINSMHPQSQGALHEPEIYKGHEVASHGAHHQGFNHLSLMEAEKEVVTDQQILGDLFHCRVEGFAYPYGAVPKTEVQQQEIIKMLASIGIRYARWTQGGNFLPPDQFLVWKPTGGLDSGLARKFINMPATNHILLLTEWGHSRDLEKGDGWERIEKICKMLSDSKAIWFATYMEISNYVEALRSVKIEGKKVKNASSVTVWFRVGDKVLSLKPGKQFVVK